MRITERANDFIKGAVNTILDASIERKQLINALNSIFKEMYITELVDRLVKVSTCEGITRFKHEMSVGTFRSGLLFEVQNDVGLNKAELQDIAFIIFGFPPMVRQLKLLGFDTLVIKGKNTERVFYRIAEGIGILDDEIPHQYLKHTQVVSPSVRNTPTDTTPQEQNQDVDRSFSWISLILLLIVFSIVIVVKYIDDIDKTNTNTNDSAKVDTIAATPNIDVSKPKQHKHSAKNKAEQSVEKQPEFPGGLEAFGKYLDENIKYPAIDRENNVTGIVICQFIVERNGDLTDIKATRGPSQTTMDEAIRVLKASPKWKPGIQNNGPVRVMYTVPISFTLGSEN